MHPSAGNNSNSNNASIVANGHTSNTTTTNNSNSNNTSNNTSSSTSSSGNNSQNSNNGNKGPKNGNSLHGQNISGALLQSNIAHGMPEQHGMNSTYGYLPYSNRGLGIEQAQAWQYQQNHQAAGGWGAPMMGFPPAASPTGQGQGFSQPQHLAMNNGMSGGQQHLNNRSNGNIG